VWRTFKRVWLESRSGHQTSRFSFQSFFSFPFPRLSSLSLSPLPVFLPSLFFSLISSSFCFSYISLQTFSSSISFFIIVVFLVLRRSVSFHSYTASPLLLHFCICFIFFPQFLLIFHDFLLVSSPILPSFFSRHSSIFPSVPTFSPSAPSAFPSPYFELSQSSSPFYFIIFRFLPSFCTSFLLCYSFSSFSSKFSRTSVLRKHNCGFVVNNLKHTWRRWKSVTTSWHVASATESPMRCSYLLLCLLLVHWETWMTSCNLTSDHVSHPCIYALSIFDSSCFCRSVHSSATLSFYSE
jgi:hypothetical protein